MKRCKRIEECTATSWDGSEHYNWIRENQAIHFLQYFYLWQFALHGIWSKNTAWQFCPFGPTSSQVKSLRFETNELRTRLQFTTATWARFYKNQNQIYVRNHISSDLFQWCAMAGYLKQDIWKGFRAVLIDGYHIQWFPNSLTFPWQM